LALPEFDPNFLRRLPDAGERARVVDKWMVQRIKQAQRTSQTLEKRLEVLNQAGAGVQKMIQSLRDRLAEVPPAVSRLDDASVRARTTTEQAVASLEPVQETLADVDEQVRAKIHQIVTQDVPQQVGPLLASFKDEVTGSLQSASQLLQEQLHAARTTAARAGEQLREEFSAEMLRLREKVRGDLLPIESDAHARLNDQIRMHHQQVQSLIHSAAVSTWEEARGVTDKIVRQAGDFAAALEVRLNTMETRAADVTARLEAALDRAQTRAESLADTIDDSVDAAVRSVEERVDRSLEPVLATLDSKLEAFRAKLAVDVESADAYLNERTAEAERALVSLARQFEGRVSDSLQQFNGQAQQAFRATESGMTELTEKAARHGEEAIEPALARLDEARAQLEARLTRAGAELNAVAKRRGDELGAVGHDVVESVDRSLHERLNVLRPRAAELFEGSIAAFRARTSDALDETMKCLEAGQTSLNERLATTRAAQLDVLQDIERSLRENVTHVERQAAEMTRLLEDRLTERVQEVVRSNRHVLQEAIAGADINNDRASFSDDGASASRDGATDSMPPIQDTP